MRELSNEQILRRAIEVYPTDATGSLEDAPLEDLPARARDVGDGLLTFVVQELYETLDDKGSRDDMIATANHQIDRAIDDLLIVKQGINKL